MPDILKKCCLVLLLLAGSAGFGQNTVKTMLQTGQRQVKKVRCIEQLLEMPPGCNVKSFNLLLKVKGRVQGFTAVSGDTLTAAGDWLKEVHAAKVGDRIQVEVLGHSCKTMKSRTYTIEIVK